MEGWRCRVDSIRRGGGIEVPGPSAASEASETSGMSESPERPALSWGGSAWESFPAETRQWLGRTGSGRAGSREACLPETAGLSEASEITC